LHAKKDGHPCFYSKIGLCSPCPGQIGSIAEPTIKKKASALYKRNIRNVIRILSGNPEKVVKSLNAELNIMSKSEKYEEAIKLRDRIYRLKYLVGQRNFNLDLDADFFDAKAGLTALIGVLKKYYPDMNILRRIECYDVSHFGQKQTTGSMVVMNEGVPDLSQYRRFRVKKEGRRSDFDSLAQVIKRRFANDWPYPDLIVVDGGRPQVKKVISEIRSLRIDLPVIGIAKDPDRLIAGTDGFPTVKLPINHTGFNLVRLVRDESHRFAKKYHLLLRRREMI
jgi:excinuclease ABC subunit C